MPQPLLLADTPHLLYRGFFALPDSITDADGHPVNALLGSVNQLLWCVERYEPRAVVCCFGQEAAHYRTELYPPYHAHRPPMPDALAHQWERAPGFYEALGWTVSASDTLEADDLMYAYAKAEVEAGGEAQILTGDRDMFQCAGDGITILLQRARQEGPDEMGAAEVEDRYGIPPSAVPDFIALRGDPSDGLPGAKGIGEKTAAELLRRHGSLEAAIAGAVREKPSVRRALLEQGDELRAFKDIATLRDAPVERPPDRPTDRAGGAKAARALGMERLAKRLEDGA
jgi:5'-3' exonuclease